MTVHKLFDDYETLQAQARLEARQHHERLAARMNARFEDDKGRGWGAAILFACALIFAGLFAMWTVTAIHKAAYDVRSIQEEAE